MDPESKLQLLMLGAWLFAVYRFAKSFIFSINSKKWLKIDALVTTSSFDREGGIYSPKIIYQYTLNNHDYMNDVFTYMGTANLTKKKAINIAQSHPEGSIITVYVNAENPEDSVIVPGMHWIHYASFILITLIILSIAYIGPILNYLWPGCEPNCI